MNTNIVLKEADLQRQIKEYLQWHGWFVIKIHQSLGSYKGIADLYAIKKGISLWIEVKTKKGKLSQYQCKFKEDIEKQQGIYLVCRSINDLTDFLVKNKFN